MPMPKWMENLPLESLKSVMNPNADSNGHGDGGPVAEASGSGEGEGAAKKN